jgi:hypothetical protein
MAARRKPARSQTSEAERERLAALLLQVQQARVSLTGAIMQLRGQTTVQVRAVLRILVALLALRRANRRAAALLDLPEG